MEVRKVNVKRFDAAFKAMLENADFEQSDSCNCLKGSYLRFARGLQSPLMPEFGIDGDRCMWDHLAISFGCYREWYHPLDSEFKDSWPETIDLTDALACIANVKRIVEKHHGPQDWLDERPAEQPKRDHSTGLTLSEFIATLGLTPPTTQPAE